MKIIETKYKGYKFRSRLEARWAVFFDSLGVEYEYEPEGFDLGDGIYYLPDFRLKCYGTRGYGSSRIYEDVPFPLYVEVKGEMKPEDCKKIREFSKEEAILVVGAIPNEENIFDFYSRMMKPFEGSDIYEFSYEMIDGDFYCAFPTSTEDGRFYLAGADYDLFDPEDEKRTFKAFDKARQARFGGTT